MASSARLRRLGEYVQVSITVDGIGHDCGLLDQKQLLALLRDLEEIVDDVASYVQPPRTDKGETK